MAGKGGERTAQRSRTRKAILQAAVRLLERGERPSLDEIAEEADVSRATAYRYFPGLDALLGEAAVDALVLEPDAIFDHAAPQDPAQRIALVDAMFDRAIRERETALRFMLARSMEQAVQSGNSDVPLRQNRRAPLIERALEPVAGDMDPLEHARLVQALSLVIGTEGFLALNDVLGLDEAEAREARQWAIKALLRAAMDGAGGRR